MKQSKLHLIAIKTNNKVFISDNIDNSSYRSSYLESYLFDGIHPKSTYRKTWYEIPSIPSKIEQRIPQQQVNVRYELKPNFPESELTPKVINQTYIDDDSPYYEVLGLYEKKWDLTEETFEEIEFAINIIEELDQFEITKQEFDMRYNFIDTLNYHPVLLSTRPCRLTKEESYKIIRNHVKTHIDPKYASITSDYDFCFTVEKRIELYAPKQYAVEVGTKRKPRKEMRYNQSRSIKIFEIAPKPYNSYPVVEEFHGENAEDLKNNINKYLYELMEFINEPVIECEHCKGRGVLFNENRQESVN